MTPQKRGLWWDTIAPFGLASMIIFVPVWWVRTIGAVFLAIDVAALVRFRYYAKCLFHLCDERLFPEMRPDIEEMES